MEERRVRRERLCARVRDRRSVARRAEVMSAEGGSPNMKNLIKAPMRITMESWPRRRPCVNESLRGCECGLEGEHGELTRILLGVDLLSTFWICLILPWHRSSEVKLGFVGG